jgi:hypothetical protein
MPDFPPKEDQGVIALFFCIMLRTITCVVEIFRGFRIFAISWGCFKLYLKPKVLGGVRIFERLPCLSDLKPHKY